LKSRGEQLSEETENEIKRVRKEGWGYKRRAQREVGRKKGKRWMEGRMEGRRAGSKAGRQRA
jgi:hypothetical protein